MTSQAFLSARVVDGTVLAQTIGFCPEHGQTNIVFQLSGGSMKKICSLCKKKRLSLQDDPDPLVLFNLTSILGS